MVRAVVHKSIRRRGAPAGNRNAQKGIILPACLNLDSTESILRFMRSILIPYTLAGKIGTRQSSAITTACKLLLDYESLQDLEKRILELEKVKANERQN